MHLLGAFDLLFSEILMQFLGHQRWGFNFSNFWKVIEPFALMRNVGFFSIGKVILIYKRDIWTILSKFQSIFFITANFWSQFSHMWLFYTLSELFVCDKYKVRWKKKICNVWGYVFVCVYSWWSKFCSYSISQITASSLGLFLFLGTQLVAAPIHRNLLVLLTACGHFGGDADVSGRVATVRSHHKTFWHHHTASNKHLENHLSTKAWTDCKHSKLTPTIWIDRSCT